jgi:hypothetical protein
VDNNSKFGTVALLRNPISLPQMSSYFFQIQVGKHLVGNYYWILLFV